MGDGSVAVNKELCNQCKENFEKRLDDLGRITEKRLDAHSAQIDELRLISERQLILSEQNTELLKELKLKQQDDTKEIKTEIKEATKEKPTQEKQEVKKSFWDTEAGKQMPKVIALIFIVVIAALAGTNLVELFKNSSNIVPIK